MRIILFTTVLLMPMLIYVSEARTMDHAYKTGNQFHEDLLNCQTKTWKPELNNEQFFAEAVKCLIFEEGWYFYPAASKKKE